METGGSHSVFSPFTVLLKDGSPLLVRPVQDGDSMEELTLLLHRAYKRLADDGFRFFATHQSVQDTADRIRDARCWIGIHDNRPVATLSLYDSDHGSGTCAWYAKEGVWHFGQFAVDPALQGQGVGALLLSAAERAARSYGARELALDTAEGARHLIDFYGRRGYRFVQYVQWSVTNYRSVVLSRELAGNGIMA